MCIRDRKEREEARKQQERFRQIYQKVEHQQASVSRQDPHSGRLLKKKMKAVKSLEHRLERENEEMTEFPDAEDAILVGFGENTGLPAGKTVLELALPRLETEDGVLAEQVNLTVRGPEHLCIIGKNGAGKTTLLRRIAAVSYTHLDVYKRQDHRRALSERNLHDSCHSIRRETPVDE